jgi:hypothetical protein
MFKKLFSRNKVHLDKKDITNFDKVTDLVVWFIKNDSLVSEVNSRTNHIIFSEGYRPQPELKNFNPEVKDLLEWFCIKVFLELNFLKDSNQKEFEEFIDMLSEIEEKALTQTMKIGIKYNFNFDQYIYETEIEKIDNLEEKELFKIYWLTNTIVSSEVRILAYLYSQYFSKRYIIKDKV